MAFDRFNDKPVRREKREGDNFGRKGGRFEDFGRDRGFKRGEGRFEDRAGDRFGDRPERKPFGSKPFGGKSFVGRPFREELGGRSGPRAKAVDKRRFSDRSAFVQSATVRLDADVAKYFKTAEDVNAALRMAIALAKTVKLELTAVPSSESSEVAKVEGEVRNEADEATLEAESSEEKSE